MMDLFEMFNVEVIELTAEQRKAFADVARTVHSDYAATVDGGPELLKKINDGIKAYNAQ